MLAEAMEKEGFWILGGVGTAMAVVGYLFSRNLESGTLPIWQLLVIIAVIWIASVFFSQG